jgi:hypothetical protein
MEGKQKITSVRNEKANHQETSSNHQKGQNGDQVTTEKQARRVANYQETGGLAEKRPMPVYTLRTPHHALTNITENTDPSLVTQGWVGDKPCLVTVDTGAYVTVARPDIATRWPERQSNPGFTLQTVSGESFPILKEVLLTLTLERHLL